MFVHFRKKVGFFLVDSRVSASAVVFSVFRSSLVLRRLAVEHHSFFCGDVLRCLCTCAPKANDPRAYRVLTLVRRWFRCSICDARQRSVV